MFHRIIKLTLLLMVMPTYTSVLAQAQEAPVLSMEFNRLTDTDMGCRFTFVVSNKMTQNVSKAVIEFAFFNSEGLVERLTALNFGALASGRSIVKQFEIPGPDCGSYSQLLINAVKACDGVANGVEACEAALAISNKTKIEFGV